MSLPVQLLAAARDDLLALYDYIADRMSSEIAGRYIDRIEDACGALQHFPERGARRDDLGPGLRMIGFEGRISIVFSVKSDRVEILRIFCGGRNIEDAFDA